MYNVNIMKNGRKKKNSKSYSIYLYFMSGADLGFIWHEEWVVGRGGEGSSPGEILGNGISNAQSQEQINARNVSFENNSQWQINIINSVKIFCYDPTLNCSTAVSLETYLLYLSNMILIKCVTVKELT